MPRDVAQATYRPHAEGQTLTDSFVILRNLQDVSLMTT